MTFSRKPNSFYSKPKTGRIRRAPRISETVEHKAVADFFKIGLAGNAVAMHVRNERAGINQRVVASRMGILPGVPDWLVFDAKQAFGIELKPRGWKARKAKTGNYTPHELRQIETHRRLARAGVPVEICETLDEVIAALRYWGVALSISSSGVLPGKAVAA